jgi:peptide/nickel transport system substrate-binding protein
MSLWGYLSQKRIYCIFIMAVMLGLTAILAACGSDPTSAPAATSAPVPAATSAQAQATSAPVPTAAAAPTTGGFPKAGQDGVPASVGKFTIAVDGWGWDSLNPVQMEGVAFLQDYLNVFLLTRDEDHKIVSGLITEWSFDGTGLEFTIHPDATWQSGRPITAADLKWNVEAMKGNLEGFSGHLSANRFNEQVKDVEVYDDKHGKFVTNTPTPDFVAYYSGSGYHQVHWGDSEYLQEVGVDTFEDEPSGGGPYTVELWKPADRIVLNRWDDFWGDTDWYHKPQHEQMEIILATDEAARFALLRSNQVDAVVNIPYILARDLPRSEKFIGRGINPEQNDFWTQAITSTGNMSIDFVNLTSDATVPPKPEDIPPFDDIRVREALEIAVDKAAISENAHFGFTKPLTQLWFTGSFGYRPEREVSPYDPERAKQLLEEAGYPDGFSTKVYFGPFSNSPGIKEWLEAAASYWKAVDIEIEIFEIPSSEFISRCCFGGPDDLERAYRPLIVQTWGRQEHGAVVANYGYHRTGSYMCCYDEVTEAAWEITQSTTDIDQQMAALDTINDHVLENRWVLPMDEVSVVQGYTDRVLSHPTPPHASSFEQLWRVVLRD